MDDHSLAKLDFDQVRDILAGYASCSLGKQIALRVAPVRHFGQISRWLDQLRQMQELIELRGEPPFGGVRDIRDLVHSAMPPSSVSPGDFAIIGDTLHATKDITTYLLDLPESFAQIARLAERIADLSPLAVHIRRVIDEHGEVRDDASERLARVRRAIADAQGSIQRVIDRLLKTSSVLRLLQYPNATFFNDRIVLPLKAEHRGRLQGIVHRISDSGATLFVEPAEAVELNNTIVHLRQEEIEEIGRILWTLSQMIHDNADTIGKTVDAMGALDLLTAKARMARAYKMTIPEVNEKGILRLPQARHPLLVAMQLEDVRDGREPRHVVPIDARLGDDFDILVITGPNTGGKTVALKTVGLLSLMVQAGLAIPAGPGATLPVFEDVLIDVGDEQSLQQSLSTFGAHITQVLRILRKARRRTLILLDELGSGTDPDEGAAIGEAVVDELLHRGSLTMISTHLGTLKSLAYRRQRIDNGAVAFNVETLEPEYRLIIGEPGESRAITIAKRLGMSKRMAEVATRSLSGKHRALTQAIRGTLSSRRKAEDARAAAEAAKQRAELAESLAQERADYLARQKGEFAEWAHEVTRLRRGDAVRVISFDRDGKVVQVSLQTQRASVDLGNVTVEVALSDLQPKQAPAPPPRPAKPADDKAPVAPKPKPRRQPQPQPQPKAAPRPVQRPMPAGMTVEQIKALAPGDEVFVRRFHRLGRLVRLNVEKEWALVSVGAMELQISWLELAEAHVSGAAKPTHAKPAQHGPPGVKPEETTGKHDSDAHAAKPVGEPKVEAGDRAAVEPAPQAEAGPDTAAEGEANPVDQPPGHTPDMSESEPSADVEEADATEPAGNADPPAVAGAAAPDKAPDEASDIASHASGVSQDSASSDGDEGGSDTPASDGADTPSS